MGFGREQNSNQAESLEFCLILARDQFERQLKRLLRYRIEKSGGRKPAFW